MAFGSFALIAFFQNKMDLAAFCSAISGALLAFLWFNIYPARFFMGDTGAGVARLDAWCCCYVDLNSGACALYYRFYLCA